MILTTSQTIKQILRQRPIAVETLEHELGARIWERMETPLATLCAAAGKDPRALLETLASVQPAPAEADWERKPAYWLVDRLMQDHVAFREIEMPAIMALLKEERMPAYPEGYVLKLLIQEFRHFEEDFSRHMAEEEEFLFPKILRNEACYRFPELEPEAFRGSVNMYFKSETHKPEEEFKRMIVSIGEKLRNRHLARPAADLAQRAQAALDRFRDHLLAHADLETNVLFPKAGRLEQELYENSAPGVSRYPGDQ